METRICINCKSEKLLTEEFFNKNSYGGFRNDCKECHNKKVQIYNQNHKKEGKEYRENHKDHKRNYDKSDQGRNIGFKVKGYKINGKFFTIEDYKFFLEKQEGKCGICRKILKLNSTHIDHNHQNGEVRGILCSSCNTGIGKLGDSIEILQLAIVYLKNGIQ